MKQKDYLIVFDLFVPYYLIWFDFQFVKSDARMLDVD